MIACMSSQVDDMLARVLCQLKALLDLGSSTNYRDAAGLTPLYHCMLRDNSVLCVEKLLYDHALTGVVDETGCTEMHQVNPDSLFSCITEPVVILRPF